MAIDWPLNNHTEHHNKKIVSFGKVRLTLNFVWLQVRYDGERLKIGLSGISLSQSTQNLFALNPSGVVDTPGTPRPVWKNNLQTTNKPKQKWWAGGLSISGSSVWNSNVFIH